MDVASVNASNMSVSIDTTGDMFLVGVCATFNGTGFDGRRLGMCAHFNPYDMLILVL